MFKSINSVGVVIHHIMGRSTTLHVLFSFFSFFPLGVVIENLDLGGNAHLHRCRELGIFFRRERERERKLIMKGTIVFFFSARLRINYFGYFICICETKNK